MSLERPRRQLPSWQGTCRLGQSVRQVLPHPPWGWLLQMGRRGLAWGPCHGVGFPLPRPTLLSANVMVRSLFQVISQQRAVRHLDLFLTLSHEFQRLPKRRGLVPALPLLGGFVQVGFLSVCLAPASSSLSQVLSQEHGETKDTNSNTFLTMNAMSSDVAS